LREVERLQGKALAGQQTGKQTTDSSLRPEYHVVSRIMMVQGGVEERSE